MIRPEIVRASWCKDTSYAGNGEAWSPVAQCAVTALLIHNFEGGKILRAEVPGFGSHYWNLIPDMGEIDLTRCQYPRDTPIPRGQVVDMGRLLTGPSAIAAGTRERFELLLRLYRSQLARESE